MKIHKKKPCKNKNHLAPYQSIKFKKSAERVKDEINFKEKEMEEKSA